MKIPFRPFFTGILLLSLPLFSVKAAPVTGYLEGENLGLIHTDYTSGDNTTNKTKNLNPEYFVGNRKDFYIDLDDPDFSGPGGSGNVTTISDISGGTCNETAQMCPWNDFAWSPRIGWITFDGAEVQGSAGMNSTIYPAGDFPHITYNGFLNGFAWGKTTGWIALSACSGLDETACNNLPSICSWNLDLSACQMTNLPASQNATEWGVFLDVNSSSDTEIADCETKDQVACLAANACSWDGANCNFEGTPRGRFFEGFAWSEHLGWISFENAATTWVNDGTEPDLNIDAVSGDDLWFPTQEASGVLTWENFATDSDSGIDSGKSYLELNLDSLASGDFTGCYSTLVPANFVQQGNSIDALFPHVGLLNTAPYGFCKYTLTGEIVNGVGLTFYIGDPLNNLTPEIKADPEQYREAITIYTFAGDYLPEESSLSGDNFKLADGNDTLNLTFVPRDIAGNPIVPVRVGQSVDTSGGNIVFENNEANWMRDVELEYSLQNDSYFDTINPSLTPGNTPVVLSHNDPVSSGTIYSAGVDGTYPSSGQSTLLPTSNEYQLNAISFAPTMNTFVVNGIDMRVKTAELPPVTTLVASTPSSDTNFSINENTTLSSANPLNFSFTFDSPLVVSGGNLNMENMVVGKPVEVNYNLTNQSTKDVDHIALDHEFNFLNTGIGGFGAELLEFRDIDLIGAFNDGAKGQTDLSSGKSRYTFLSQSLSGKNNTLNNTVFFDQNENHHPTLYSFERDLSSTPSNLNSDGQYAVEGSFYGLSSDISIDRGDFLSDSSPILQSVQTLSPTISITPVQIGGLGFTQSVDFELAHFYIAYRMVDTPPGFDEFAVYEAANPIGNVKIQNIGLNTSGLVSGGQIFESAAGNRTLSTVSTQASASLQKEINRNVSNLTRNVQPCDASNLTLTELSTEQDTCIIVNQINKTVVAYYSAPTGELLTLNAAGNTLTVPEDYSYTIILEGGADVFIRDNLVNGNEKSSFGLIVFDSENTAEGGNVYLDPDPTNMVGLLYAEGSLLSSPDGSSLYYGNQANASDLINQLYWQGKIASKNTLGGAPNLVTPPGIDCGNNVENLQCAQRYDLDYLRRFTTINTAQGDYSLNNGKFSGDGTCNDGIPSCSLGLLPTTIKLNANNLIELSGSKSVDPVYIEPSSRRIPLGFSKEIELTQDSVVR